VNKLSLLGSVLFFCVSCSSTPGTKPTSPTSGQIVAAENPAMALYTRGQSAVSDGKYSEALAQFTRVRKQFPEDKTAPQALLGSGYAHFKLGDSEAAVDASNAFIQTYPQHSLIDYAYYLRGLARYSNGLKQLQNRDLTGNARTTVARKAFESFSELVRRFPNSKYNQDARIRMEVLHSKLAEHEIKLAKNALSFNKYKEAIARSEYIIKNYARSETAPEAYSVMIEALTAQGDLINANDVRKALNRKYPDYRHVNSDRTSGNEVTRVDPFKLKQRQSGDPSSAVEAAKADIARPRSIKEAATESQIKLITPNTADPSDFAVSDNDPGITTGIKRESWYLSLPSGNYTLQLLGTNSENALHDYIEKYDIADEAGYFRTRNENSDWFTLTYGNYRSKNEAIIALQGLSSELKIPNPWIRPLSDIQNKLSSF